MNKEYDEMDMCFSTYIESDPYINQKGETVFEWDVNDKSTYSIHTALVSLIDRDTGEEIRQDLANIRINEDEGEIVDGQKIETVTGDFQPIMDMNNIEVEVLKIMD